ncbi:MAG: phosphate ABC transporter substrate-binding protein PstS [Candidatus Verstraetearchaeota archaeon]|nr:phosphate ABC transporter substrate-binding protein PstS [Candidatus Verstraetearchaeota archaeon]
MHKINGKGVSTVLIIGIIILIVAAVAIGYYFLTPPPEQPVTLTAGGASFPYPLMTKWTSEYNKLHPNIQISYQSIGSGGGQNNLKSKTFDFACSDAYLTDAQIANYSGPVLHLPETAGGVVVSYNVPGVASGLKLDADTIAKIFQANITKWNDPTITAMNPDFNLPNQDIVLVRRSDSSGTTFAFTGYLRTASTTWTLGQGTTVNWPAGIGAPGNAGVASTLLQTPYSIGYLEFWYAYNNSIPYATVKNHDGQFVVPSLETIGNAARAGAPLLAKDMRASIANLPGDNVYPISTFTYVLVYKDLSYMDQAKATAVVNFLWWAVHDGQNYSEALLYPKLPAEIVTLGEGILHQITYQGMSLI